MPAWSGRLRSLFSRRWLKFAIGALCFYLVAGFMLLPAVLKWQLEKQVTERFGHRLTIDQIRFNPLSFRVEVRGLALSAPDGSPMLAFDGLAADFELRSVTDRAWTFAEASLRGPRLSFALGDGERHNFSALLEQFATETPPEPRSAPPRLVVRRISLDDGEIDFSDARLAEPRVLRIAPLSLEITPLSTLPEVRGQFRFSARTDRAETLELAGELGLAPIAVGGRIDLAALRLETVARALSRALVLAPAAGEVRLATRFDVAVGEDGALTAGLADLAVELQQLSVAIAADASSGAAARRVDLDMLKLGLADARLALTGSAGGPGNSGTEASLQDLSLELGGGLALRSGDLEARLGSLRVSVDGGTLRDDSATVSTARLVVGKLEGGVAAARFGAERLALGTDRLQLGTGGDALALRLAAPRLALERVRGESGEQRASIGKMSVDGRDLALDQDAARSAVKGDGFALALEQVEAAQQDDALRVQAGLLDASQWSFVQGPGPASEAAIAGLALQLHALAATALGSEAELLRIANTKFEAATLRLEAGATTQLVGGGLDLELGEASLDSPADGARLAQLANARFGGGELDLAARRLDLDSARIEGGEIVSALDHEGRLNWLALAGDGAEAAGDAAPPPAEAAGGAWRVGVAAASVSGLRLGFTDRQRDPALALGLESVELRAKGLDTGATAPAAVDFGATLTSGGTLSGEGDLRLDSGAVDLRLKLAAIDLTPVQPFVADFLTLKLASAALSAEGRLRVGEQPGLEGTLAYEGSLALDRLQLVEAELARPFLSWNRVGTGELLLSLAPDRLDIGELAVDGIAARVIIAADQSVNIADVVKQRDTGEATEETPPAAETAPFPVSIARIRFQNGSLDFADLSLTPRFAARMHELAGVIAGVGTTADNKTELQLDAKVDEFGAARIRGHLNLLKPEKTTAIEMGFRNLQMNSLSPYVAKFAGYKIASGKLNLDLQYQVEDKKLKGQNKLVLEKVKLGEKVDSPDALDLPLELAIAILSDSNGVIDVALPVGGDLDDPQFDYRAVIGKAIGSLIGGVVSAPFRALGKLLGANAEELGAIEFDPGSAALAPPEREKLVTVAKGLHTRPQLMLKVPPTHAGEADRAALRSLAVRSEILRRMGIESPPGEDPGPVDTANTRVQQAIEAGFAERFAPEELAQLKASAGPDQGGELYRRMLAQMVDRHPLGEAALDELARARAQAVLAELTRAGGLGEAQAALDAPAEVEVAEQKVAVKLAMGVVQ